MDKGLSRAVRKQFVELYHRGFVYRGERIVNWDPSSQTTLSDLEVDREERPGHLYTLAYQLEQGGHIAIATVRPETIFADQAIAVHPDDDRYRSLVGNRARIPLTDRWIPVITDDVVDRAFGTGALKITPAHDPLDFEIGERHQLERPSVIGPDARLFGELVPSAFRGLDRFEAREAVVEALEAEASLLEVRDHTVALGLSQRTKEPVEPMLSLQWFYDTDAIAERVLAALDEGEIQVFPQRYAKVNRDWLSNLRHWNISRQLWWGHQIPAWYDKEGRVFVPERENPEMDPPDDPRYRDLDLVQDQDVFDTWFSSNLWPFSTLGWPDMDDPFYHKFYPTSVLVTGYDILFFWVARMEMAGFQFTDQRPFDHVLLHGLVLDEEGQKMSKSKGNGIDPLDVVNQHGADALRFAMTYASTGGQDVRWDSRRVEMGRNFNNKLWNAARFVLMNLEGEMQSGPPETLADRWMLSTLQRAIDDVTVHLDAYDLGLANRTIYDFVWSEFCDWYLEAVKPALRAGSPRTRCLLKDVLTNILGLLHPLIPFISSELYQALGYEEQLAMAAWPTVDEGLIDEDAELQFGILKEAVAAVRNLRSEANLAPSRTISVYVEGPSETFLQENRLVFESLARADLLQASPAGAVLSQHLPELEIRLPLEGLIDVEDWRARQQKKLGDLESKKARSEKKLANDKFVLNAPPAVVEEERRRLTEMEDLMSAIRNSLAHLQS
jgi:valyl-tRNA synthetase